jgi:hypothetical protein
MLSKEAGIEHAPGVCVCVCSQQQQQQRCLSCWLYCFTALLLYCCLTALKQAGRARLELSQQLLLALLLYCCFTAALLLLYCCFTAL